MALEDIAQAVSARPPIRRPSIEALLGLGTRRRVCLVIGAAGWGKTTAVSSWASGTRATLVRLDTERFAADSLLAELNDALRPHVRLPVSTQPHGTAVERRRAEAGALCHALRDQLSEDLVLVSDDLQVVHRDSDAAHLLQNISHHAPDHLHLLLVSRQEPPFSLRRLRGQGQVAEIAAPELAFEVEEVRAVLRAAIGELPPALPGSVLERTAGWPALVNLLAGQLPGIEPCRRLDVLDHLTLPGERLHDFLAAEVVGREPESVRQLLCRLAVSGRLGSGPEDANLLGDLARRGLVRSTRGDGKGWSLVRPLLDHLAHETVSITDHRTAPHRAADVRPAPGEPTETPRHLAVVGIDTEWDDVIREPDSAPVRAGSVANLLEPSTLAWRMAQTAFTKGRFAEARAVCQQVRGGNDRSADATWVLALEAVTCRVMGDLTNARSATALATANARRSADPSTWAAVHIALGLQASAGSDRRRAEAHWADALRCATAGENVFQETCVRVCRAAHLLEFGLPRQALPAAQSALQLSERHDNRFLTAHSLTVLGRTQARLGAMEPAVADLTRAVEILQRMGSSFLSWPLVGLAEVHRKRGHLARARAEYEEALRLAEGCHDVLGIGSALTGLARVRAADDLTVASALAERAIAVREGLQEVSASLTRGWVALQAGDLQTAASAAARAGAAARLRRDDPGLAEALVLGALTSERPGSDSALVAEAIDIWKETGCLADEATGRIVAARVGGLGSDFGAERAYQTLRELGVDATGRDAGPLAAARASAPSVSICTLGAFQVVRGGAPVPKTAWQSKKARELLKVLVTRRRPVHREQLIELLWPGADAARSGNRLSVLLSMIRDVLQPERDGDGPLATDGNAVWLDRQHITIDVEKFLVQAGLALRADADRAPDATDRLVAAEAIYLGDFLEDDPYQEWAQSLTEEVRATHVALLRALIGRLRRAGDLDAAVRYTLRLLAHDDYDEQAHLDLVTVHLEAGRFGEARRRYGLYVTRMKEMRILPQLMPDIRHHTRHGIGRFPTTN